ncbi:hypothetical protein [Pseudomonas quasicaspiana]|uniref:hypothetical protein n=1 Tax=Pseudomonas quasicaspiana TaxID=2829821 RepID=UPI001E54A052|nr:hypothetical protein [Pseudomonas quasicaspiana]MCD5972749.1 hypothetical protein [Pseudomonas quasicaspiana]
MKKFPERNHFYSKLLCKGSSSYIAITIFLAIVIAIGVFTFFGGTARKVNDSSAYEATSSDAAEEELKPASTSNSGSKSLPALHVVLTWESIMIGENWERKNYRAKLDACQGSGMPTRALSSDDEAKLGTGEVEILIDARRQFARQTRWTFGADGDEANTACLIKLEAHVDQSAIEDDTGMYEAIDSDSRIQERQNMQSIGWKLIGEEQIKSQPCTRWQNDRQSVCTWSGGMKWGFGESPSDAAGCTVDGAGTYLNAIPLEAEPVKGGSGCRMQVKSFSLGKGLLP